MSGIEGGAEDTVAWASWPPPQIYVFEMIRNSVCVQEELKYILIKLFPNITALFYQS